MSESIPRIPAEYIVPLNMNGLRGRLLRLPPPNGSKREVLIIGGHHTSLERMYSLTQVANDFAGVTMPDLPGFGGMDSFYKIGEKPDMDTMADYLASLIKLRFKGRKFSIIAFSYGFTVVTRMLQRYPDIVKKVDILVSAVGFAHYEDFVFKKPRLYAYRVISRFFSGRVSAAFFRAFFLYPPILRIFYSRTYNAKHKFKNLSPEEHKILTEFEVHLWRLNDVRTWMKTTSEFFHLNNCHQQVDLPVWHIYVEFDNYFDNRLVEQHMRVIFTDFKALKAPIKTHFPNVISGKSEAAKLLPAGIKKLFEEKS